MKQRHPGSPELPSAEQFFFLQTNSLKLRAGLWLRTRVVFAADV
jgi:hypothetical protein